jgi:hypothetical protein
MLLLGVVQVCTTTQQEEAKTAKGNFKGFDVALEKHTLNTEEAHTLNFESGTQIRIPENTFVDGEGKPIKGAVSVDYREFHSIADVLTSGITMDYDSAGTTFGFETAGMFEMRAHQDGKEVFIEKGKDIKIDLASYQEGTYNFYYLEETPQVATLTSPFMQKAYAQRTARNDKWKLLESSTLPTINKDKQQAIDSLDKLIPGAPTMPEMLKEDDLVLDFKLDLADFPALKEFEGVIWVYAGSNDKEEDPSQNEWIFSHNWSDIQLKNYDASQLKYELVLNGGGKSFTTIIRPALKGKSLKKAERQFAEKMANYEKRSKEEASQIAAAKAEKQRLSKRANFRRSFRVQNLGIYNCDIISNFSKEALTAQLDLQIDNQSVNPDALIAVYLINNGGVLEYRTEGTRALSNFSIDPIATNQLIALLPDDKVAIFGVKDFEKVNWDSARSTKSLQINLKSAAQTIKSTAALNELIRQNM